MLQLTHLCTNCNTDEFKKSLYDVHDHSIYANAEVILVHAAKHLGGLSLVFNLKYGTAHPACFNSFGAQPSLVYGACAFGFRKKI
jgi:hypothetical protein